MDKEQEKIAELNLEIDNIIKQARFNKGTSVSFYRGRIKAVFSEFYKPKEKRPFSLGCGGDS